ncbi:MAG: hypothetical protein KAH23_09350 [Kiritimatiellae bacterium]|nr:hypothetical protein [Kiritimatiellia bacterium]
MRINIQHYLLLVLTAITTTTILSPDARAADNADVLQFMNRDKFHGTLLAADPGAYGLRWKHESVKNPIDFTLTAISQIKFAKKQTIDLGKQDSTIQLTNDDILTGKIISLNNEQLILDTWYAGKINVKRTMIKEINPRSGSDGIIYEGPSSMTEWQIQKYNENGQQKPGWIFKNNSLYANYSSAIGKDIDTLPDLVSIKFKAAWRGYPSLYFAFFTDNLKQYYSSNCYLLQINNSSIYLQRYTKTNGSRNLGNINYQKFRTHPPRSSIFNMLVNKKKRTFALLIDGTLVKQWTDSNDFAGLGSGILFQPQQKRSLKLSDIKISVWDGEIPDSTKALEELAQDLLRFTNNDKVSGTLSEISDENVKFKTTYADLSVPLHKVTQILMSTKNAARARPNPNDIRANFTTKGVITLQITKVAGGKITGNSENFGIISMPIDAFSSLDFNIHEEKVDDDDEFDL